ncbi:MAG: hypothetical protein WC966_06585 [Bradymonadales bacterium]
MNFIRLFISIFVFISLSCDNNQNMCTKDEDCYGFCEAYEQNSESIYCSKGSCFCKGTPPPPIDAICDQDQDCAALCATVEQSEKFVCKEKNCYCQFARAEATCTEANECSALCKALSNSQYSLCVESRCYCKYTKNESQE